MYLRDLFYKSGVEELWPTWRKKLLEEVPPTGILFIDAWRIRRKMDDVMEYVHLALWDNNTWRKVNLAEEKVSKLQEQQRDLTLQIEEKQDAHNQDLLKKGWKIISLQATIIELKDRVMKVANSINAGNKEEWIELICVPWIDLNYSGRLWVCGDNGYYNWKILRNGDHRFIVVRVSGNILGHIKLKWEDTFLSYVDAVNEDWKRVLKKGGIYTIEWVRKIVSNIQVKDDWKIYVHDTKWANFNYMRMSRLWRRDKIIDAHRAKIESRQDQNSTNA